MLQHPQVLAVVQDLLVSVAVGTFSFDLGGLLWLMALSYDCSEATVHLAT